jgi:thioredoxin-related protein
MKNILFSKKIFLSFLFCASAYADVQWHSMKEMFSDVKNINKPIAFMVGDSTCHFCVEQRIKINMAPDLVSLLNDKYYSVYVNHDVEEIPKGYVVTTFPTLFVLNPRDGNPIAAPAIGPVDITELTDFLVQITNGLKKIDFSELQKKDVEQKDEHIFNETID